ncbi:hypothetical protein EPO66_01140 [bacterium]|nr:MAG: hypothetical protein EPO66_01140 [bacterium]
MNIKKFNFIFICILALSYFAVFNDSYAAEYTVTKITNSNEDDWLPDIYNGQIAWESWNSYGNSAILFYDGVKTQNITGNSHNNFYPQIHNGQVVWEGWDGNDSEIFFYDGVRTNQLTNNTYADRFPQIYNGQIVWESWDGNNWEIYLYDGVQTKNLTNNERGYLNYKPQIHNGQVVWEAQTGGNSQIFFYDGIKTVQLTNNNYYNLSPQIHNGQVVWETQIGNKSQIFFYDGIKTAQLTNNNYYNCSPQIHNGQVAWCWYDGPHSGISIYDGSQPKQLISSDYVDSMQINNGQVAWVGYGANSEEIFFYDGNETIQLTDNAYEDWLPQISDGQVTWMAWDGNDYEIFLAKPAVAAEQPTLQILDASDFSAGPDVTTDIEQIVSTIKAGNATSVEGAVTDGVTRLLLVVDTPQAGAVKWTLQGGTGDSKDDGVLYALGGSQKGNILSINTVATSEGNKAFCVYQAPEDFVRNYIDNNHDGRPDDEIISERAVSVKIEYNNAAPIEKQLKLVRPPLVLVHGIWSSREMWDKSNTIDDFKGKLEQKIPGIRIFMPNYPNTSHFSTNKNVPYSCPGGIVEVREQLKQEKIAMVQADVLGYSMGGLLSRIWAGAGKDIYTRYDNFESGDINKLITLDSPHYGSFLADLTVQCILGPFSLKKGLFLKTVKESGYDLNSGAVYDLMTSSYTIKDMNRAATITRNHAIIGNYIVPWGNLNFIPGDIGKVLRTLRDLRYDPSPYVIKGESDLVASVSSQAGGLVLSASSVFNHQHVDSTSEEVANKVIELLNADDSKALFQNGFPQEGGGGF